MGRNAEVRALADLDTKEIDLKGKTVVPGFIDTHPHVIAKGGDTRITQLPLKGLHSIDAIKKAIVEKVEKTPPGEWIATSPIGEPPEHFHVPDILQEKRWPIKYKYI